MLDRSADDVHVEGALLELASASRTSRHEELLARVAAAQHASAGVLRARGHAFAARRAESAASRARLAANQPAATARMFSWVRTVREDRSAPLERVVEGAMALLGADFANLQLRTVGGGLRIASHSGFSREFLEHFSYVARDSSACGRAAATGAQVVVADVACDAAFEPHREIARSSGFRAVQSTPFFDRGGHLLGVLSTHFCRPHQPSARDLLLASWFVDMLGSVVNGRVRHGVATDADGSSVLRGIRGDNGEDANAARYGGADHRGHPITPEQRRP